MTIPKSKILSSFLTQKTRSQRVLKGRFWKNKTAGLWEPSATISYPGSTPSNQHCHSSINPFGSMNWPNVHWAPSTYTAASRVVGRCGEGLQLKQTWPTLYSFRSMQTERSDAGQTGLHGAWGTQTALGHQRRETQLGEQTREGFLEEMVLEERDHFNMVTWGSGRAPQTEEETWKHESRKVPKCFWAK